MLSLGGTQRIFLCQRPVDFRKAHDGLCAIVRDQFEDDPFSGDLFVFHNGAKDRLKLLYWDQNGFWLLYKRLEQGRFPFDVRRAGARVEIDRAQLSMMLEGIDWQNAKRSSRFTRAFDIKSRHGSRARSSR